MATLLTTPSVVYPPQDQFTQAQLIAMGAKNASPNSQIQTQAVSLATPGVVVGGAYGTDQNGVKTQYQAYTNVPKPQTPVAPVAQVTNQPVQAPNPTGAPAPTSNTSYITSAPTAGDIYSGVVPAIDKTTQDAYDAQGNLIKDKMKPVDETAIRNETMKRFQSEIDAIQQYYADLKQQKLNEQAPINEGRLGSNAAIEARRGMIGSDFGNAQTSGIEKLNQQSNNAIISSVGAEMNAAVQAVLGKARDAAQSEIDAKKAAKDRSAQDYIDFLKGAADRKDQRVTSAVNNLVALGQTPDDTSIKAIADQLGIDPTQFKAKYLSVKATLDAEKAKNAPKPVEGSQYGTYILQPDGTYKQVIAPVTPSVKPISRLINGIEQVSTDGGITWKNAEGAASAQPKVINRVINKVAQYSEDGGKTWHVSSGAQQAKLPSSKSSTGGVTNAKTLAAAERAMTGQLKQLAGPDGFIAPDTYTTAKKAWVNQGFSATSFDTKFRGVRNPENPYYTVGK